MVNISLSRYEARAVKFLKEAMKKTLNKSIIKAARKGKVPSDEVLEDINVGVDKGSRANFWGWIRYF